MKTASLLRLLVLLAAAPLAMASTPIEDSRPLAADATLVLENVKGRIAVNTWDRPELQIRGSLGDGTDGLEIDGSPDRLKVRVKYPQAGGWFGGWGGTSAGDSDLQITAPAGISLEVKSVSARVEVRGLDGPRLSIESVSGDVEVSAAARDVFIETVSGRQRLDVRAADVAMESVSGTIDLRGAVSGRISLESVSGALRLDTDQRVERIKAGVVSGAIDLRSGLQPGGRISVESLSGKIVLTLPAGTSAKVTASSFTGAIRSSHGEVRTEKHGPGASLQTTLGAGDGVIELENFSGSTTLQADGR